MAQHKAVWTWSTPSTGHTGGIPSRSEAPHRAAPEGFPCRNMSTQGLFHTLGCTSLPSQPGGFWVPSSLPHKGQGPVEEGSGLLGLLKDCRINLVYGSTKDAAVELRPFHHQSSLSPSAPSTIQIKEPLLTSALGIDSRHPIGR